VAAVSELLHIVALPSGTAAQDIHGFILSSILLMVSPSSSCLRMFSFISCGRKRLVHSCMQKNQICLLNPVCLQIASKTDFKERELPSVSAKSLGLCWRCCQVN